MRALATRLEAAGEAVVTTREPGGSPGAEAVRALLVEGHADRWDATAELFLLVAARQDHLARTIRPALAGGAWVLCDRFWDSTRVYQAVVGGLPLAAVDALHGDWLEPFRPGLTLVLDLPAETGLARAAGGRFEAKGLAFHERVREAYRELAAAEPARLRLVDAVGTPAAVASRAAAVLDAYRFADASA